MPFHFTAHCDNDIDQYVENQLSEITAAVISLMGEELYAILLSGGFGRGEGSVLTRSPGNYHIVNDYDIDVVYREPFGRKVSKLWMHLRYSRELRGIASHLSEKFDIKQIDLSLKGLGSLREAAAPTLANFDLKHGHHQLHGDSDPVNLMGNITAESIPEFEGTWLLRNRGIGLLLASFYLTDGQLDPGKEEYFYIEINKAILGMGDALFIQKKCYTASYAERAKQFTALNADYVPYWNRLQELYTSAAHHKLFPGEDMYPDIAPQDLWIEVSQLLTNFFLYFESLRLQQEFISVVDYADRFATPPEHSLKSRLRSVYDRYQGTLDADSLPLAHLKQDKARSIALTMALISARCGGKKADTATLEIAEKLAGTDLNQEDATSNWRHLTRAFLLLIHPKGELGKTLGRRGKAP